MSTKFYLPTADGATRRMFLEYGFEETDDRRECDIGVFVGGADVTPELYGEKNTDSGTQLARDIYEISEWRKLLEYKKKMVGICRGGQFLNVMAGGKMKQHIDGHALGGTHEVTDLRTKETYQATSTHHQLILPSSSGRVVAAASILTGELTDTESVYYEHTRSLSFQPHPEYGYCPRETTDWFFKLLEEVLDVRI